jgi:hypothetical protein
MRIVLLRVPWRGVFRRREMGTAMVMVMVMVDREESAEV